MLRPVGTPSLERLHRAATADDAELDMALLCVGVLAPLDLEPIRAWMCRPACTLLPLTNHDGHRVIGVYECGRATAWIHHDGRVVTASEQRAELEAGLPAALTA